MKHLIYLIFSLIVFVSCTEKETLLGTTDIIPKPNDIVVSEGHFEFSNQTTVSVENESQVNIANRFFSEFETVAGWLPQVKIEQEGDISFKTDSSITEEAYNLEVSSKAIEIKASSNAGFFYALQTLKQLLPAAFYSNDLQPNIVWCVPAVIINDKPAFEWRGYMLDVSRHFFDVDQVKAVLDFMAESKLNRFHWHLTDDQGWRLEIKSFPKLTDIGAWRVDYNIADETISNWWGRPNPKPDEKATYGGFYTQEDVKEIIAYAKDRFIEVIPEIDMPGHAQATIAAYPEIGCVNAESYVATGGAYQNNTYNPGKEETFDFAKKMLNEVMDLFPYKYVHIGGDECNKSQWLIDPDAQRRIKEEGLKDVYELQSYFIRRIEKIINERGRIMIGWDEILEGGLAPNATVMSWRGEEGGIKSVKAGHEVIMTPSNYCYIDLKQGHDDLEPNLGYSRLLLSQSYSQRVVPDALTPKEGKLVKGIQANLWTESISDWSKLCYMTFPRLYAIAESAWTIHQNKNWDHFANRLLTQFDRLDAQKIRFAVSAFSPWIDHTGHAKSIEISLKTEVDGLDIYYTLDGSNPNLQSVKYVEPFSIQESTQLKSRAFNGEMPIGYESAQNFSIHKAVGLGKGEVKRLTDLNYGSLNNGDPNWVKFKDKLELEFEFDIPTKVSTVDINALRFTIAGIYPPEVVEIYGSSDGSEFILLGTYTDTETALTQGRNKIPIKINFDTFNAKIIRVKAKAVSPLPNGHHKAGTVPNMKIDEVVTS